MMYKLLQFTELGDEKGKLIAIEGGINIPFDIKRIFYIYGSDDKVIRGKHANINSEFVLINVAGTSKLKISNGKAEEIVILDEPMKGIYIPKMIWKEMYDFSADSVLLVITNTYYDSEEYIRDYDEYLKIINE